MLPDSAVIEGPVAAWVEVMSFRNADPVRWKRQLTLTLLAHKLNHSFITSRG